MSDAEKQIVDEHRFHTYTTHAIPWWVRAIWLFFWVGTIAYFIAYLIPAAKHYF